jgi:effector-binding domain-containing protein
MEVLPIPNNKEVKIKKIPSHVAVVIRFSGNTTEAKIEKMTHELKEWASHKQLKLNGGPNVLRYDPPWKPGFLRRNEISLSVKE